MTGRTNIEWCDYSWNPVTGCSKVSEGCRNCYAEALSHRFGRSFDVTLHPDRLTATRKWQPGRIFVNSMSDLFHEKIPFEFITEVMHEMDRNEQHTYLILTKRPRRMAEYFDEAYYDCTLPRHIWLGTSIESRRWVARASELSNAAAFAGWPHTFFSLEPLLESLAPFDWLERASTTGWVIAGGESGPHYRPAEIQWFREVRDYCLNRSERRGIPFFLKQLGGMRPGGPALLDGREWRELPPAWKSFVGGIE
jgi:protein gp37